MYKPYTGRVNFKVYPRKIHVYCEASLAARSTTGYRWGYAWSTNAYKTCREAVQAAKLLHPEHEFKANFAKD